ncbi:PepSY-associated TM helix domain-containing protein [Paracnuella aquatica]|uniref:PepSY-associated TM helix domain-containing protein n=1 Tax=Paracnuella aquatica TaxID=2268757 RepID=UPI000DEF6087|nr:PepSY-associated TM helix domain-containing protein [Paracnuella aquatica]RPD44761.1 PepSY domain-containing protein [Paracnuella aquatica]
MTQSNKRQQQAKVLRLFRQLHRQTGVLLFVFFAIVSITTILLGWKKNSGGMIQAKSYKGTSTNLRDWLPMDSLHTIACRVLHDSVSKDLSLELDRIDVRHDKGMVKFIFVDDFLGVQLDGATGELLHIEKRWSDLIEKIHDGSILDHYFNTSNDAFKLIYTTIMGVALMIFTVTGFWLWYGPKRMRKQ